MSKPMTNQDNDESLIAHLEALRETPLKCLIVLGLVFPFMLFAAPKVLECLTDIIISDSNVTLNYFSPAEVFIIQIKTAAVLDLIVCFPYIAKKIWDFILPALYENERKFIKTTVLTSTALFVTGVLFCIFFILPLIIKFGLSFSSSNIKAVFGISNIINLSLWMSISFGLMFQLPLITYSLIKSDIIPYESISDKRSYVIVGILIIAGILTPPDVVSKILLALPTYMLFELGLFFARRK